MKMPGIKNYVTVIAMLTLPAFSFTASAQESANSDNSFHCFNVKYENIKIPRLTNTDYVIFLIRSAKDNILLNHKVIVATKVDDERFS